MNDGITLEEACQKRLLESSSFKANCNEDGTVKQQAESTTFTVKGDDSQSVTVDNVVLFGVGAVLVVGALLVAYMIIRRIRKR